MGSEMCIRDRFYCCWCHFLHYGEGKCCPVFGRWCRRYAVHFTAVGAAFYTTARVNAARFSAVCVGVMLPNFTAVVVAFCTTVRVNAGSFSKLLGLALYCPFYCCWCNLYTTVRVNAARFSAVSIGVILPISLLLVPPFTLRLG